MTNIRTFISVRVVSAAVFCIAWVFIGLQLWPEPIVADSVADRLGYALRFEFFVALTLLLGVASVAARRFFSDDYIDGSVPEAGSLIDIDRRYVQNTLEQAFLAIIAHITLALFVPITLIQIVPILVGLFVFARLCFWIGYHISPKGRAFGFATTFQPTVVIYIYLIGRVLA